ncbi:diguanylate cyclase (GGDEF)-like protein/PAS domain S-box-containing protein [Alkalibacillus filiformis]|uniref:Diguanylate cyclase (GGDEF)-like protein/PAS domain S-box-containing protein n=1 Tax=Alkalibacillus filiformis TaxID=200990 RepID=A0ABU0DUT5_9BACI|nr:diguanylate cyclase [Alkalibacillus filiformis]MDQ0352221.1 diguanylate cyclase (GGDEF)-like protein/PAS domain S-box-containing protein [Alkalibacillus filiformis]
MSQRQITQYKISAKFLIILALLLIGQFADRLVGLAVGEVRWSGSEWPVLFDLMYVLFIVAPVVFVFLKQIQRHLKELEKKEAFMDNIFENMYEGVSVVDGQGNLTKKNNIINDYIDLDYNHYIPFEEWTSYVTYLDPQSEVSIEPKQLPLMRALRGEKVQDQQLYVMSKNGVTKYLSVNAKCLRDDKENIIGAVSVARDITKQKQIEQVLSETNRKYEMIANNMNDLIAMVDKTGVITYASPSHKTVLGYEQSEYEEEEALSFVHPDDREVMQQLYDELLSTGKTKEAEYRVKHKDQGWVWIEVLGSPIAQSDHQQSTIVPDEILLISREITERKKLEEQLKQMAYYDELTDLPNRKMLDMHLKKAMARTNRTGESLASMFIDLDGFKEVNDKLGHDSGDELLKVVAARFVSCLREEDFVSRYGGDEFVVILENIAGEGAKEVAERIIEQLSKPISIKDEEVVVSPSIGISHYPDDSEEIEELLSKADQAMYYAKSIGKNTYQFYHDDLPEVQSITNNPIVKVINQFRK